MTYFYAMQCPHCGAWRCCQVQDIGTFAFRCFSCGKQRKVRQKDTLGLAIKHKGPFGSARECRESLVSITKNPAK